VVSLLRLKLDLGADSVNFQGLRSLKSGYRVVKNNVTSKTVHTVPLLHMYIYEAPLLSLASPPL
jgi:hypothetical protein